MDGHLRPTLLIRLRRVDLKIAIHRGSEPMPNTEFLGSCTRVSSIGSAVYVGLTNVTNRHTDTRRQTDRPRYSVCSNRLLSHTTCAMWPKNK